MVLTSCGSDDNNVSTTFESQNIETKIMLKGYLINALSPDPPLTGDYLFLHTYQEFLDFFNTIPYVYIANPSLHSNSNNPFDFDQYQLLVVFNLLPTIVKSINVTSITEYENEIVVVVENLESDHYSIFSAGMFYFPIEMVRMPKTDKPIVFDTSLLWLP